MLRGSLAFTTTIKSNERDELLQVLGSRKKNASTMHRAHRVKHDTLHKIFLANHAMQNTAEILPQKTYAAKRPQASEKK
jgi:hypothetical protein